MSKNKAWLCLQRKVCHALSQPIDESKYFLCCAVSMTRFFKKDFIRDGFQLEIVLFRTDFYLAHRHFLAH